MLEPFEYDFFVRGAAAATLAGGGGELITIWTHSPCAAHLSHLRLPRVDDGTP